MIKVLFICHGNICRSPMAEFVMKHEIEKRGIADNFFVSSAATSSEEIWNGVGNPVYPPAKAELAKHGISCDGKRAVQVEKADYEKYDLLICMEDNNVRNLMRIIENDPKQKVHKLLDYTKQGGNITDPWYTGDFTTAYNDIVVGIEAMLEHIC